MSDTTCHAAPPRAPSRWRGEILATLALAWPLILGQVAIFLQQSTNILLMGWLGAGPLAAGTLAMSVIAPLLLFAGGVLTAVATLVAQSIGGGEADGGRRHFIDGLWAALLMSALALPLFLHLTPLLVRLGQDPATAAEAGAFAGIYGFVLLPALAVMVFRNVLAAHGLTHVVLSMIAIGTALSFGLGYLLTAPREGLPQLGLRGIAYATIVANLAVLALLILYVRLRPHLRGYRYFYRLWQPDLRSLGRLLLLGVPIGLFVLSESGLFTAAQLLAGRISTVDLAGMAISFQYVGLAFAIPLGLGVAAMVRVGWAWGAGSMEAVRRAGWTAIGLVVAAMCVTSTIYWLFPEALVGLFLDPARPENLPTYRHAVGFMAMVALLQVADGLQGITSHVLRGISDTLVPMLIGLVGYWPLGFTVCYLMGFPAGLGGTGIFIGLVAGLGFVGSALALRFALLTRPRAHRPSNPIIGMKSEICAE